MQLDDVVVSSSWVEPPFPGEVAAPEVPSGAPADEETPAAAESDPDSETGETERETEPDAEAESEPEEDKKPQKKGGFQKRIDKLTRENRELQERLAGLAEKPAATPAETPKEADSERPKAENFKTWEEYEDAALEWKSKEIAKRTEAERVKAEAAENAKAQRQRFTDGVAKVRERYADFDTVVNDDVQMSLAMRDVILESDHGAELLYALAKDPAETARIAKLSPLVAARELGKLETRVASPVTPPVPKPQVSAAAVPVRPLRATAAPAKVSLDSADFEAYKAARKAGRTR